MNTVQKVCRGFELNINSTGQIIIEGSVPQALATPFKLIQAQSELGFMGMQSKEDL